MIRALILTVTATVLGAAGLLAGPVLTPLAPAAPIYVGDNVEIEIEISDAVFINGYQFDLAFPQAVLKFVSVADVAFQPFALFASPLYDDSDTANGNILAITNFLADAGINGKAILVKATFLVLGPGPVTVTATGGLYTQCDDWATCNQSDITTNTIAQANFETLPAPVNPIPEPSALALALTGLAAAGIGALRRK